MKKKFSLLLVLLLAVSTFLAACGGDKKTDGKKEGAAGDPIRKTNRFLTCAKLPKSRQWIQLLQQMQYPSTL